MKHNIFLETTVTDLKLCMKTFIGTIITISNISLILSEYRKPKTYIGIFLAFNLYITVYGTHHTQNSYHQLHDNYFGQAFEPELGRLVPLSVSQSLCHNYPVYELKYTVLASGSFSSYPLMELEIG